MNTHSATLWATREPGRWRILNLTVHGDGNTLDGMPSVVPDDLMPGPPPGNGLWIATGSVDVRNSRRTFGLDWRVEWREATEAEADDLGREDSVEDGVRAWRKTPVGPPRGRRTGNALVPVTVRVTPRARELMLAMRGRGRELSALVERELPALVESSDRAG